MEKISITFRQWRNQHFIEDMVLFCENCTVCRNVQIASFPDETPITCVRNLPACCDICGSDVCIIIVLLN
jgi:hypothetical protein